MDILSHAVVPVAHEADARRTARALEPYDPAQVTVVYVVEKGGGAPDKTPVSHSKEVATEAFEAFGEVFPAAETEVVYATKIAEAIIEAAETHEGSAIVYQSRGGSRLLQFLSGDLSLKLVTKASLPVVALPAGPE